MKFFVGLLLLAGLLPCAVAEQMTTGDLYKICTSASQIDKGKCTFYILGVFEGAKMVASVTKQKDSTYRESNAKPFCVPEGLDTTAMELIVKMKMGEVLAVFPQDKELPAVSFIVGVITRSYACQK